MNMLCIHTGASNHFSPLPRLVPLFFTLSLRAIGSCCSLLSSRVRPTTVLLQSTTQGPGFRTQVECS